MSTTTHFLQFVLCNEEIFAIFIEWMGCTEIMVVHPNCIGVTKDAFGLLGITMGFAHGIEYNETGLYTLQ